MVKGKLEKYSHLIFLPPDNFPHSRTSVSHHHNERAFGNISSTEHSVSRFAELSARYFGYHLYSLCCLTSRSMCTERKKHIRLLLCTPTLSLPSELFSARFTPSPHIFSMASTKIKVRLVHLSLLVPSRSLSQCKKQNKYRRRGFLYFPALSQFFHAMCFVMLDVKFEKIFVKRENLNFSEFCLSPTQGFVFSQSMKRLRGFINFCNILNILLSVDKTIRCETTKRWKIIGMWAQMASHSEHCDYFNVNSKLLNHLSLFHHSWRRSGFFAAVVMKNRLTTEGGWE